MKAALTLMRWPNMLIIAFSMFSSYYCLSVGANDLQFIVCLTLSIMLMAGAGNVVNDIMDYNIDLINKPEKVIIGNQLSKSNAWILYGILNALAIMLGSYAAVLGDFGMGNWIIIIMILLLYFYSSTFKTMPLIGNVIVAALSASAIILPHWFDAGELSIEANLIPYSYTFFAFLVSLIREIVKDIEDQEGDAQLGAKTLAIVLGQKKAKMMVYGLIYTLILLITSILFFIIMMPHVTLWSMMISAAILLLAVLIFHIKFIAAKTKEHFHSSSSFLKLLMLLGILSMFVFRFTDII